MFNLIIAVLCSVAVSVLLKVARKRHIEIQQAIAFNYIVALSLSWFLLKPDFKGLEFTDFIAQSENTPIFLALGILLPSVFIIMSKAVEFAGIVRSDAAQRLSLFLPILAAFLIFHETLSQSKVVGIVLAFVGLFCLLSKPNQQSAVAMASSIFCLNKSQKVGEHSLRRYSLRFPWLPALCLFTCYSNELNGMSQVLWAALF